MAKLYICSKECNNLIKINTKDGIRTDVDLIDIDYLTLMCNSQFFEQAYNSKCINLSVYQSKDKTAFIKENQQILNTVMFDNHLKYIVNYLYKKKNRSDVSIDYADAKEKNKIDRNLEPFLEDLNMLFRLLKDDFVLKKLNNHFKDDYLSRLFNDYINYNTGIDQIISYFTDYQNYRMLREYFRENIYYLCITLDADLKKYHVLACDDKSRLDEYTMKFKDSDMIRKKYKDIIEEYLKTNNQYLSSLSRKSNGSIVILKHDKYGITRTKVLYSDTKSRINKFLSDLNLVKKVALVDYKNKKRNASWHNIFSDYQNKTIYYKKQNVKSNYTSMLKEWKRNLFDSKDYDLIRIIFNIIDNKNVPLNISNDIKSLVNDNLDEEEVDIDGEEFLYEEEMLQISGEENDYPYGSSYKLIKGK